MKKEVKEYILNLEQENNKLKHELNRVLAEPKQNVVYTATTPSSSVLEGQTRLLDREAKLALLEETMNINAKFIFKLDDNALEMVSFSDWLNSLTREDLVGGLEPNELSFSIFDEMTLTQIKNYYHEVLKMLYDKKKKTHIEVCTTIINQKKKG